MIVCVAVDDNLGMTFNKRRQSQDRVLRERLLELTQGRNCLLYTSDAADE